MKKYLCTRREKEQEEVNDMDKWGDPSAVWNFDRDRLHHSYVKQLLHVIPTLLLR
jgi:hypothetical protein